MATLSGGGASMPGSRREFNFVSLFVCLFVCLFLCWLMWFGYSVHSEAGLAAVEDSSVSTGREDRPEHSHHQGESTTTYTHQISATNSLTVLTR